MKKILLVIFVVCFCNTTCKSQYADSLKKIFINQTIYRFGGHYIKGNERLDFHDLEGEFDNSELGWAGYVNAKKYRTVSKIFRYVSLLSTFAIAPFINGNNKNAAYIFLGINFSLGYGSSIYNNLSNQCLDRAIWQRNKDLLFPEK